MKTTTLLLLAAAALFTAACGTETDPAEQFRDAMPKKEAIRIGTPAAETPAGALSVSRDAMVQTPSYQSEFARLSYWTAVNVNVGVWWTLELLQAVTSFPPTTCGDAECTWGPWRGDDALNYWKLHVLKVDGSFVYELSAQPASDQQAPWAVLISGTAVPGADRDHGRGSFLIDFDAQDALQHASPDWKKDYGQLTVTYDNTAGLFIQALFQGARNDDPERLDHLMNAAYRFDETGTAGDLQIAFEDVDTTETFQLRTRWVRGTGEGRADAHYEDLDALGDVVAQVDATECWAGAAYLWAEDFDRVNGTVNFGTEANCAPFAAAPSPIVDVSLP